MKKKPNRKLKTHPKEKKSTSKKIEKVCKNTKKGGVKEIIVTKLSQKQQDAILDQMSDMEFIQTIMGTTEHKMKLNTILDNLYINHEGNIFEIPKKLKIDIDNKGNGTIKGLKSIRRKKK